MNVSLFGIELGIAVVLVIAVAVSTVTFARR
jgi:hypothetical protein